MQTGAWQRNVKVLQIYEEATREASGNYSSVSVVIPVINSIVRSLDVLEADVGVMRMKREMLASLKQRYSDMESNEYYAVATLMDPRFKQRVFSSSSSGAKGKQMLIFSYGAQVSNPPSPKRKRVEENEGNSLTKSSSVLWQYCSKIIEETSENESSPKSTELIIDCYLKEPNQPRESNPLDYWKSRQTMWPNLALLAQKYLCSPPATVASERLFSAAANICTDSRNRLSPKKVEQLLFLKENLPVIEFKY